MTKRLFITALTASTLASCASIPTFNSVLYESEDNKSITLLELEYEGRKYYNLTNSNHGLRYVSYGTSQIGKDIKIKWRQNDTSETKSLKIPLDKGLPFNMHGATIRLIFNQSNKPEIYIIYKGPDPYLQFEFKNTLYTERKIRQVYPTIQEIKFNTRTIRKPNV